jgi:hypothetical protein
VFKLPLTVLFPKKKNKPVDVELTQILTLNGLFPVIPEPEAEI